MSEWTADAIYEEERRRAAEWAQGICPDSGLTIQSCKASVCDCFQAAPIAGQGKAVPDGDSK